MSILEILMNFDYSIEELLDYTVNDILVRKKLDKYLYTVNHDYDIYDDFDQDDASEADYDEQKKILTIYHKYVEESLKHYIVADLFKGDELFERTYTLLVILHELRHAFHLKLLQNGTSSFSYLLYATYGYPCNSDVQRLLSEEYSIDEINKLLDAHMKENAISYAKWGVKVPYEKEANCYAASYLKRLLNPIKKQYPLLYSYCNFELYDAMLTGYMGDTFYDMAPFVSFLKDRGDDALLSQMNWYDEDKELCLVKAKKEFSLNRRMSMGLPISRDELDFVMKKYCKNEIYKRTD